MKLRIARFIYDWPPPWIGLAPGPYEISRTQSEMGHDVTVFAGATRGARPEGVPGGRVIALPRAVKGMLFFTAAPWLLVRYALYRISHRVDVIHGHAHVTQWFNLWRLLFRGRIPYFYQLHVTFAGREKILNGKGYRFSAFEKAGNVAGKLSDRWGCRAADHVFTVNDSVKDEAVSLIGIDPGKITVIKNGVNAALFAPRAKDSALLARLGLAASDPVLLYVGVLHSRKNLGVLLQALPMLPQACRLVLAGDGPAAYVEKLKAEAQALGLADRVLFAGYVSYPELPAYYSLADVFVLPSLYEGMPKVLLEALAGGKPAVLHSGYGLDPDLEAYVDKVDCTDPARLAAQVRESLQRGFKGDHAAFIRAFSWRAIMEKVEAVYRRYLPAG